MIHSTVRAVEALDLNQSRACIVFNQGSGKAEGPTATQLRRLTDDIIGPGVEILEVSRKAGPAQLAQWAVDQGCGTVAAAGGDGTIAGVASALNGTGVALGVLPLGTFNYFARGLDIPQDAAAALEVLRDGTLRALGTGTINGQLFLNNASIGVYPAILKERETLYSRWGRSRLIAYWSVLSGISALRSPYQLDLTIDGALHQVRTALLFVANSAYQLNAFNLDGAEAVRDGQLAIFTSKAQTRGEMMRHAVNLMRGATLNGREFDLWTGRDIDVSIRRRRKVLVARDGEKAPMPAPFKIQHNADALRVIAP
jgi:diacylglycerol kinase family enzyme